MDGHSGFSTEPVHAGARTGERGRGHKAPGALHRRRDGAEALKRIASSQQESELSGCAIEMEERLVQPLFLVCALTFQKLHDASADELGDVGQRRRGGLAHYAAWRRSAPRSSSTFHSSNSSMRLTTCAARRAPAPAHSDRLHTMRQCHSSTTGGIQLRPRCRFLVGGLRLGGAKAKLDKLHDGFPWP